MCLASERIRVAAKYLANIRMDNLTLLRPPRDQSDSLDPAQRSEAYTPRTDSPGGPGEVRRERWRPEWVYCRFCPKIGCPRMLLLPDCKPQNASPVHVQLGRGCTRIRHHGRLSAHIHLQFLSFPLSSSLHQSILFDRASHHIYRALLLWIDITPGLLTSFAKQPTGAHEPSSG